MKPRDGPCAKVGPLLFLAALTVLALPAWGQQSVYHDAWLNSDFINFTGQQVNDFTIIFESDTYNPAEILTGMPFPNAAVSHPVIGVNTRTKIAWSGANIPPNGIAHMGMNMTGSGKILDAYWTNGGVKVGPSLAISYELTEIRTSGSGEIHMQLLIAPGYYEDRPTGAQAGWENIRTFRNIPANYLGLSDLNQGLDLNLYSAYEIPPEYGNPGLPGTLGVPLTGQVLRSATDSFFDVYVDEVGDSFLGPQYESLLVATVINAGQPIGTFWNLNPQCPEPGALMLVVLSAATAALRRSRGRA